MLVGSAFYFLMVTLDSTLHLSLDSCPHGILPSTASLVPVLTSTPTRSLAFSSNSLFTSRVRNRVCIHKVFESGV